MIIVAFGKLNSRNVEGSCADPDFFWEFFISKCKWRELPEQSLTFDIELRDGYS